jgi:hypothetical protein
MELFSEVYVQDVRASENQTSTRHSGLRADAVSVIIVPPFTISLLVDTATFSLQFVEIHSKEIIALNRL